MAKAPADIRSLARAHTERAIQVLQGIMDQPDSPHAARVAAANSLLDRGWGKPMQSVEVADVTKNYVARMPAKTPSMTEWEARYAPTTTQTQ